MKSLKGTKTERILLTAFAGESQARNRYTYAAGVAVKEGYEQIAAVFLETADNEKEHAQRFYRFLEGGMVEINGTYPAGVITSTDNNLRDAAAGEHLEWTMLYVDAASIAREEGFPEVATQFDRIAEVENQHEKRYLNLLQNLEEKQVFRRSVSVEWKCRNCGYHHFGEEAPKSCPACAHPQAYFELFVPTY
ncbi:MAG: rubrerythrin family protein [Candidatus Margulisiibacteriota bacterium]|nr:MAG: rubrerythrin [Candidatus Margulisbacteria bacterium GWD2_39_127]OGI05002.1 MAG: rubrerythrin [Candidatus Margulisbacteria bacterium GWF2_38_17]OGI08998.1 MAG: rubrerythrin [Candidatus Margulisbacteria bacterium GWE2_39_32]PZM79602.1 MAG: rubrerythrin family protein [Candidatus Margulisiibacteriota bacterium]HAR63216.1 rubrerythrin family protein [Candidatus Margulisiibacteriota bacterium]